MQISNVREISFSKCLIALWENSQIRRVLARENLNYYQKLGYHQHQALSTLSLSTHTQSVAQQHLLEPVSIWFVRIFHMWIEAALYLGSERNQCHRLGRYWNSCGGICVDEFLFSALCLYATWVFEITGFPDCPFGHQIENWLTLISNRPDHVWGKKYA